MKNAISISLAGMIFYIDEDAYEILKHYMERIKDEIKEFEGSQEIINDIETRIAELIKERLNQYKEVVNKRDIEEIIAIMGKPEDISGGTAKEYQFRTKNTYKRMYRNPDDRILGGVCSGMAAYWNLDVVLIRVVFVLLTIFGMAGVIIYVILWVILPEANTITQKLEMKGEEVTIHSIIEFFKQEFQNVKRGFKKR